MVDAVVEKSSEQTNVGTVDQKTGDLTKIRDIKKLYDRFVLNQGDVNQQQLVESWLHFFEENLERGQGSDLQGKLGILPNAPIDSIPFDNHPTGKRIVTDNRERKDSPHNKDDALFATDVYSILSGIAELLFRRNYGVQELGGYKREPEESDWVVKWATHEGKISEVYLLTHGNQILKLIRLLRPLLVDFYTNGARPPEGYSTEKVLLVEVAQDIAPLILERTEGYGEIQGDDGEREVVENRIIRFLIENLAAYRQLGSYFTSDQAVTELTTTRGRFTALLAVKMQDGEVFFLSTLIQEYWYLNKRERFAYYLAEDFGSTFSRYIERRDEPEEEVAAEEQPAAAEDEAPRPEGGGDDAEQREPHRPEPRPEQPPSEPSPFNSRSIDVDALSNQSALITALFISREFVSQGIDFDKADALFGADLRREAQAILATYTDSQIAQLFLHRSGGGAGLESSRGRLLNDLFGRFISRPDLIQRVGQLGLNIEIKSFSSLDSFSSGGLFKQQLNELFNLSDPASAIATTLSTNSINRLDTIILSYGLNDALAAKERENHQDAAWFISQLNADKLALIFFPELSPEQARALIRGNEGKLIAILVGYAKTRSRELVLHTNTTETAKGFFNGVSPEDQKAATGSIDAFHKHFNFTSHPIGDIADEVSQNGGEKAAGVFVGSAKSKAQLRLEKLYGIFIAEWIALGPEGQKRVYEIFELPPRSTGPNSLDYLFLEEFVTLTPQQMRQLREPRRNVPEGVTTTREIIFITDEQRETAKEISMFLVLQREELVRAQELVKEYLAGLDQEVISAALSASGPNATYDDLTLQRLYQAQAGLNNLVNDNQEISDAVGGERRGGGRVGRRGGWGKQLQSRFGDSAKKRLGKVLGNKAVEGAVGMATSPWLQAAKWLMDQENRPIVGGALLGLGTTIYNMFSNGAGMAGGIGGGLAGAGVGFWLGGPIGALIGGLVGAGLGAGGMAALFPNFTPAAATAAAAPAALPYSVQTGLGSGGPATAVSTTNTAPAAAGQTALAPTAQEAALASSTAAATTAPTATSATVTAQIALAKLLSGVGTATLAPIIFLVLCVGTTLHILTIIQSAFLVSAPFDTSFTAPAQAQFFKCTEASISKPTSANVISSSDGKYAFPLDGSFGGGMSCPHYFGKWAVDIFTLPGSQPEDAEAHLPVLAYTSGTIYMVVTDDSLGGLYVILKGDDNRWYYYAHNCAIFVTPGQQVGVGEVIAASNRTGVNAAVTREHLHFAIQEGGNEPNFTSGGNVCPTIDFREKFTDPKVRACNLAPDCATVLPGP